MVKNRNVKSEHLLTAVLPARWAPGRQRMEEVELQSAARPKPTREMALQKGHWKWGLLMLTLMIMMKEEEAVERRKRKKKKKQTMKQKRGRKAGSNPPPPHRLPSSVGVRL